MTKHINTAIFDVSNGVPMVFDVPDSSCGIGFTLKNFELGEKLCSHLGTLGTNGGKRRMQYADRNEESNSRNTY